jgi:hypothetical protein
MPAESDEQCGNTANGEQQVGPFTERLHKTKTIKREKELRADIELADPSRSPKSDCAE